MLEIEAETFYRTIRLLSALRAELNRLIQEKATAELDALSRIKRYISPQLKADLEQLNRDFIDMKLPLSAITLEKIIEMQDFRPAPPGPMQILPYPTYHISHESELLDTLSERIADELKGRIFLSVTHRDMVYYQDHAVFDTTVLEAFPSVEYDVREAGRCFALERHTASVFHCMRIMEVGLDALRTTMGVDVASNWNKALELIEKAIRGRSTAAHGPSWKEDEAFYSEAAVHFRVIKNAWRNHTMHGRENFDQERARAILHSTADFMRHLATRLQE